MARLDELVEKQKAYTVMVAACGATGHDFRVSGPFSAEVGKSCSKCDIAELPWLRGEVVRLTEHADALSESLSGRSTKRRRCVMDDELDKWRTAALGERARADRLEVQLARVLAERDDARDALYEARAALESGGPQ